MANPRYNKQVAQPRQALRAGGQVSPKSGEAKRRMKSGAKKEKRLNMPLEKVYGQVADRSRKRLKKRGNIKIEDLINKGKEDITEAGKAMGAYKYGGRVKKMGGGKKPGREKDYIKEKIAPKEKMDRLKRLRKELGMKKGGSVLKPVDKKKNPGLAKLPTHVRNKMGYMKDGGRVKKFGGGKK